MPLAVNHISVDCVVIGFDGEKLSVLLVKRMGEEDGQVFHDMKLPGGLIYTDENLDDAARRVLRELTGIKTIDLLQFKAYGYLLAKFLPVFLRSAFVLLKVL